jgi:hypothetical protein
MVSSDGGVPLLADTDKAIRLVERFMSACNVARGGQMVDATIVPVPNSAIAAMKMLT